MEKYIYPAVICIVSLCLMSGCSWLKGYGKLRVLSRHGEKVTIREEKELEDARVIRALRCPQANFTSLRKLRTSLGGSM